MKPLTDEEFNFAFNMPFSERYTQGDKTWENVTSDVLLLITQKMPREAYNSLAWQFSKIIVYMIVKERNKDQPVASNAFIDFNKQYELDIKVDKLTFDEETKETSVRVRNFATDTYEWIDFFDTSKVKGYCMTVAEALVVKSIDITRKPNVDSDDE